MVFTPETTEVSVPTTEQVEADTRKKLDEAKSKIDRNASAAELLQTFLKDYKKLDHKGRMERLVRIISAIIFGNLTGIKPKAAEVLGVEPEAKKTETETTVDSAEGEVPKEKEGKGSDQTEEPEPKKRADTSPPIDTAKFRSGSDVIRAIMETFPGVEARGRITPLKTSVVKDRPGAPGWTKKNTDDWDYASAGNTDEEMEKGNYSIQATVAPDGYSREGTENIPEKTAQKLTQIANALRTDPRMSLFTGIAMTVDGVEVMMVKEIHMHKRGTASEYLCQPHTGVSYIVKNS